MQEFWALAWEWLVALEKLTAKLWYWEVLPSFLAARGVQEQTLALARHSCGLQGNRDAILCPDLSSFSTCGYFLGQDWVLHLQLHHLLPQSPEWLESESWPHLAASITLKLPSLS